MSMTRFQEIFRDKVAPAMITQFGYKSTMEVPRIT